jgi:CRISPR-associated protein Cas2
MSTVFREQHLYVVAYDIRDERRWRRVFRMMKAYGEWMQLSVFQCRLTAQQHAELVALLDGIIHHNHDHVILMDLGPAERVSPRVVSLGRVFVPLAREVVVI